MHKHIQEVFNNGCFVLLPVDVSENPILCWRIQITKLAAALTELVRGSLKDLNGREVPFENDSRPAARFLYYHSLVTLLRNERDRQPG